jgi:uncharacterized protein (AIM24 family)
MVLFKEKIIQSGISFWVMLNGSLRHLLSILKLKIKDKFNVNKDNFLHFRCTECTSFKIVFLYLYS